MPGFARSLLRLDSYRSVPYAALGLLATLPTFPFALVFAALVPGPGRTRAVAGLVGVVVALALAGLLGPVRRLSVALTNGLLGTMIPAPPRRPAWADRIRSGVWLALHAVAGGLVAGIAGFLLLTVLLPIAWLDGDPGQFFTLSIEPGWGGAWTVPFALAGLVLVVLLAAAVTHLFRLGATVLLGPSAAERAALAEHRAGVLAQRNRLARELHDSIGHTLTTSTLHAAAAADLLEHDPESVRRALGTIEESSRTALEDLDHVLGLLRDEPSAKAPERTLADVDVLAVRARDAGVPVELSVTGPVGALPATVSREAYRIVQEGLTNAVRHAHPGPVTVGITAGPERLRIELTNPLPDARQRTGRRGLTGLAERVEALRGELTAGPAGTDWVLVADLPLRSAG